MMAPIASSLMQPVASSLIHAVSGKRNMRVGKRQEGGFLALLELLLMIKAISGKGFIRERREYNNIDQMDKYF